MIWKRSFNLRRPHLRRYLGRLQVACQANAKMRGTTTPYPNDVIEAPMTVLAQMKGV